ncbi:MAG: hypothetical protein KME19_18535 [Microcoleus vaginatus WJT46-NPBG5]|jgi:hypothetical protein|nr:hypothetical protein [Microcoleus vaginatus WJT46-NPBG5]
MRVNASILLSSLLITGFAVNFLEIQYSSAGIHQAYAGHVGVEQGSDRPKSGGRRA